MHVHLVLIKLTDPADRERCRSEMLRMDGAIEGMVDLTVLMNECDGAYAADIGLRTRWSDAAAYRAYQAHPLHLEVRAVVLSLAADAATIDYTAGESRG